MIRIEGNPGISDRTGRLATNLYNHGQTDPEMAEAIVAAASWLLANDAVKRGEQEPIMAVDRFAANLERNFSTLQKVQTLMGCAGRA